MHEHVGRSEARRTPDEAREMLTDLSRADDDDIRLAIETSRDVSEELAQVLRATRLVGVLVPATPMSDRRIVTDVPGRAMVGGHIRCDVLDREPVVSRAHDRRFAGIDPHERRWTLGGRTAAVPPTAWADDIECDVTIGAGRGRHR